MVKNVSVVRIQYHLLVLLVLYYIYLAAILKKFQGSFILLNTLLRWQCANFSYSSIGYDMAVTYVAYKIYKPTSICLIPFLTGLFTR